MLMRCAVAMAAILLAIILLIRIGANFADPEPRLAHGQSVTPANLPAGPPVPDLERTEVAADAAVASSPLTDDSASAAQTGMLRGLVLDAAGAALAHASVAVIQERTGGAGSFMRWARTNADGYFEILAIPAGNWSLRLARRGPRLLQAEWCWGEVAIHAGQSTWLDVSLAGTRTLTGRFLVPHEDGLGLALVLRTVDPPLREVGQSEAVMSADLEALEAGEDFNPEEGRSGEFWFWGLAPARYELSIYLDVPRQHCVRRLVDLRAGDGDLGTEVLRWEDFFSEERQDAPR